MRNKTGISRILGCKEIPIVLFTLLVYGAFAVMAPNFNSLNNVAVIVQQITINGIVALAMTIVIMIGGMDLSVGSLLSLCGSLAAMMDLRGFPVPLTILLTLLSGAVFGALNGLLIVRLHIPDIIVTLATMNIYRGVAVMITRSQWLTNFSAGFMRIGSGKGGLLSVPVLTCLVIAVVLAVVLKWFPFGRLLYAYGGNQEAAALMGLNVASIKIRVYLIDGVLMGVSGLLFASTFGSIQAATAATSMQFQTMSAALIGGANIFGGAGSVLGTMFGTILMGLIKNGLVQIHASEYWLDFITGAVILLALMFNLLQLRGRKGRA